MFAARSLPWAVLFLCPIAVEAQPSQLSYVDATVCCLVRDGQGGSFVISSSFPKLGSEASTTSVAKLDSSGRVKSTSHFATGDLGIPYAATVDPGGDLWIVGNAGLILKLDPTGTKLLSMTTFGGPGTRILAVTFDMAGNLFIAGATGELDFPVTPGAFMTKFPSLPAEPGSSLIPHPGLAFLTKFAQPSQATPPYTLVYSTLLGGIALLDLPGLPPLPLTDISALAIDANGKATVAGITTASDFPVTMGAYRTQYEGNFTPNVFVTRFNAQGSALLWSTFLGVSDLNLPLSGLAVDSSGNVVVTGIAARSDFPVTAGALQSQFEPTYDTFVAKLDAAGSRLLFSTFYGAANQPPSPPRLDEQGNIWITEAALNAAGVPLAPNSLTLGTAVISEIASDGSSVIFSELLPNGMAGQDLVLNPDGTLTVAGTNGFVLRVPRAKPAGVSILGVADSAASGVAKTMAPGEFVSIYGTGLGPAAGMGLEIDANGQVGDSLAGTQVTIGGVPAPLLYVSDNQINTLVPYDAVVGGSVNLQVTTAAGSSQMVPFDVLQTQPNIFAVLNADGSLNSRSNPALMGTTVSAFVSGAGVLNAPVPDGAIAAWPAPAPALSVGVGVSYYVPAGFGVGLDSKFVTPAYAGSIQGAVVNLLRVDFPVAGLPCSTCMLALNLGAAASPAAASYGATSPTFPLYIGSLTN
jgi:uncharacterized protein (TIGR03437 family)